MSKLFSQRYGFSRASALLQIEELDSKTRVGLWNALFLGLWQRFDSVTTYRDAGRAVLPKCWDSVFGKPLNLLPHESTMVDRIRSCFLQPETAVWHQVLDIIELTIQTVPPTIARELTVLTNEVLARENAGYRIVGDLITPVTDPVEAAAIDEAIGATTALHGPHEHLRHALTLLADHDSSDYRNSIKEAVSAVESACKILAADSGAKLSDALHELETNHGLHPALKRALGSLYGYTSDADGIRHGMINESTVTFIDAKFIVVTCAAFVNYLLAKASIRDVS
jgi:hypothetical protein